MQAHEPSCGYVPFQRCVRADIIPSTRELGGTTLGFMTSQTCVMVTRPDAMKRVCVFFSLFFSCSFLLKLVGGIMSNGRGWLVLFNTAPKPVLSLFLLALGKPGVRTDGQ